MQILYLFIEKLIFHNIFQQPIVVTKKNNHANLFNKMIDQINQILLGIGVKWPISEKIFGHMWLQLNYMTINLMTH